MNETMFFSPLRLFELEALIEKSVKKVISQQTTGHTVTADRLMTIKEAAAFIKLSPTTVYNLVMKRQIPFMKNRQRLYFSEKQLRDWIEAGRVKTGEEIRQEADQSTVR